jgi:KaiC/GvpD/RAD55 family RecA-like ATPase
MPQPAALPHAAAVSVTGRCAYCGYRIPVEPVRTSTGTACCSEHCRNAVEAGDQPYSDRFAFKRRSTGVAALDALLPQGYPANSFVLLSGDQGLRHRELQAELVWRTLARGEPAVVVTFVDPAVAVVEQFLTLGWNVLPFLERGDLQIIDCFTSRLREDHQTPQHQVEWNAFLAGVLEDATTVVLEPSDLRSVEDALHARLEATDMIRRGIVVIDSLNEVEIQGQETETEQFVKEVRGDICSRKFVPIFASVTVSGGESFLDDSLYLFDGIVETRHTESLVDGVRLKQLSIGKMDGVLAHPDWVAYENGAGGFRTFDPVADLAAVYGPLSYCRT